jgi:hypothetical protein
MKRIAILAIGVALMLPAMALASGSPTCQAYSPQLCSVNTSKVPSTPTEATATTASTLPFTGLNVGLLVLGGGALLGAGFVMRRFSRRLN